MITKQAVTHQSIRAIILDRIHKGEWTAGTYIPGEADLAVEFGCSRTTVNRALQQLAEEGLVERRRKRGTRITPMPVAKTTLEIPIIRKEVTARGGTYSHHVLVNEMALPPISVQAQFTISNQKLLHLNTLHLSDNTPFMYEERWVNPAEAPGILEADFKDVSPNEWLVKEVPYSDGDISFSASSASERVAAHLEVPKGAPVFLIERTTRMNDRAITALRMYYPEGFRMTSKL
ncbi:GntR family transcriptional regulator [Sneathiella limimaris]|uniref:GntR family transcriptional regulator n=1 Tax=Sneathiella limimaris TaxID=1964213 RepID=UPI00146A2709|nr:UTRA domain-containing protein [Sneathiella limimaris]